MKPRHLVALSLAATLGFLVRLPAQSGRARVFTAARVIDGTGAAPIENATIVVRDGRIADIGPAARVAIPSDAVRTPLAGKTVIPGLINAHGHVGDTIGLAADRYAAGNVMRDLRTYASYGVTSVVSLGGDRAPNIAARDSQKSAGLDRARLWTAGPVLDSAKVRIDDQVPASPAEARTMVADISAMKVDIIKMRVDDALGTVKKMPPEIYRAVIDEAHKRGLRVAVHIFYLADAKAVLEAGADFIAHSVRDADVDQALIAAMKKRDVCLAPTLMREVSTFVYESTPPFFSDPLFLRHADPAAVAALKEPARQAEMRASPAAQRYKVALAVASRNLKKLSDAGIAIAMGTDTGPPARFQGYFELMELELMAKAGLTPRQVLAAATRDAARCMKVDTEVGTLERGKWADFVALDADPLADVSNVKKIDSVWIAGNRVNR
jgi:imidazolonepropionase-like amidohydrolase